MRHTFASLLLAAGEPITYVSHQLGHRDPSITLRVYSHWLPDTTARKGVDRLDDTSPNVAQAWPDALAVNDESGSKSFVWNGEPGGNRTHNPQIKSLLLCQLSYRPEGVLGMPGAGKSRQGKT